MTSNANPFDLAPRLELDECPYFARLGRASIAFAVELHAATERPALRISQVHNAIFNPGRIQPRREPTAPERGWPWQREKQAETSGALALTDAQRARAKQLFAGSRSFLDDITTGDPGVNGRPMLLAAEAAPGGPVHQRLTLRRTECWSYDFEGLEVGLKVAKHRREFELDFREHLCVFESGRILYVLVLSDGGKQSAALDEYALLQLQQLAIDPGLRIRADYLAFRADPPDEPADSWCSLHDFIRRRLAALSVKPETSGARTTASALHDVLVPFGMLERPLAEGADGPCLPVRNAIVMIEDEEMFAAARHTLEFYRMDGAGENAWTGAPQPLRWLEADNRWRAGIEVARSHTIAGFGVAEEERPIPRPLKAFAGLTQAVPDFPRVDESELHDATRPISIAPQNLFYNHPAVQLEIGVEWRTFREAQDDIGACPYAMLTWLIAVHDELIVADMEVRIERMLLGEVDEQTPLAEIGPTRPMRGVDKVMQSMRDPWPTSGRLVDKDLEARINIFRWCSIHRAGNVFRYATERELLANITAARGTGERFDNAHQMLDRYENLIEDVSALACSYSSRNTNFLLGAITAFGVLQLVALVDQMGAMGAENAVGRLLVIAFVLLVLFALWRWIDQLRR